MCSLSVARTMSISRSRSFSQTFFRGFILKQALGKSWSASLVLPQCSQDHTCISSYPWRATHASLCAQSVEFIAGNHSRRLCSPVRPHWVWCSWHGRWCWGPVACLLTDSPRYTYLPGSQGAPNQHTQHRNSLWALPYVHFWDSPTRHSTFPPHSSN